MVFENLPTNISGLTKEENALLAKLVNAFTSHMTKNAEKQRYYEGKVKLSEVNLGIALPEGLQGLEIGCSWGAKAVDVLAARSMFDGYVGMDGKDVEELDKLVVDNRLVAEYAKACRDELLYGCTFATLSKDPEIGCKIRFHSPNSASALWDGDKGRVKAGLAIIDMKTEGDVITPSLVYMYTDTDIIAFVRGKAGWKFQRYPHKMGRPLMEPLVWNATSTKPFGRSRIKEPVRRLIQGYVRTIANASIGLEFSTSPQKYFLGVTDEQFEALTAAKFKQYVGAIIAATSNPETGEKPTFGQLQQGTIAPHVEMVRVLATQFSAATGLPVTDTGVVSDANPTSSDAILAQTQTLVGMAEQLNVSNGDSLRTVALMALAIAHDTTVDELTDAERDIVAHFRNPALPSVAVTADAAIKIATSRPEFAATDTFLEMIGFDKADVRRIKAQEQRVRGMQTLEELGVE